MEKWNAEDFPLKKRNIIMAGSLILAGLIIAFAVCVRCSSYFDSGESHVVETIQQLVGGHTVASIDDTKNLRRRQEMLSEIRGEYAKTVAWLTIPGTMIDYPVMQAENDSYYVDHSYDGESDVYGTPFLAADTAPDFSDRISLVYGRDMANGTMFGSLDAFLSSETFDSVTDGVLVLDHCMYQLSILACTEQSGDISDEKLTESDCSGLEMLLVDAQQCRNASVSTDGQYLVLSDGSGDQEGKSCILVMEMTRMDI